MSKVNILKYNLIILKSHIFGNSGVYGFKDNMYNSLDIGEKSNQVLTVESVIDSKYLDYCITVDVGDETYIFNSLNIFVTGICSRGLKVVFMDYSSIIIDCSKEYALDLLDVVNIDSLICRSMEKNVLYIDVEYSNGSSNHVNVSDFKYMYVGKESSLICSKSKDFMSGKNKKHSGGVITDIGLLADGAKLSIQNLKYLSTVVVNGTDKIIFNNKKYSLRMSCDGFYLLSQDDAILLGKYVTFSAEPLLLDVKYVSFSELKKVKVEVYYE